MKNAKTKIEGTKNSKASNGFTLIELMVVVTIVGILTTIATPNYINSLRFAKQKHAEIILSGLLAAAGSFQTENGRIPNGWDDLNYTQPLQTANGIASGTSYSKVQLTGKDYSIEGSISGNTILLEANSSNLWNVVGCINTTNGLSAIKKGPLIEDGKPAKKQTVDPIQDCPSIP
jgi:prepilin-type N-terminal cleavage/methylation domain-containing protein